MRQDRALLLYALVKGYSLNIGKIMERSIMDYAENNFSGNIPHTALITLLCTKGCVTFSETEEKSLKPSPLTLTRVLKTPVEGKEVKRIRKRKMVEKELPRETVPIVEAKEEFENEERRGFEDYTEQPVLSPTTEKAALAPVKAEERGKRRVEEQESCNTELLSLLKEIRKEMNSSRRKEKHTLKRI